MAEWDDDEKLAEWADEHLAYEMQQLRFAVERLAALGEQEGPERNMAIESFALHTRCLLEFLWYKRDEKEPDSLRALHFCEDWRIDGMPHALAGVPKRINKEIVHLTYGRQRVVEEAKGWDFEAIFKAVAKRLREFTDEALPDRLYDSTREHLKELAEPKLKALASVFSAERTPRSKGRFTGPVSP